MEFFFMVLRILACCIILLLFEITLIGEKLSQENKQHVLTVFGGLFVGIAIELLLIFKKQIADNNKKSNENQKEFKSRLENFEKYMNNFKAITVEGREFIKTKDMSDIQRKFFIKNSIVNPLIIDKMNFCADKVKEEEFYQLLIDSLDYCKKWQGIHDGKIELLIHSKGESYRNKYLKTLADWSIETKKVTAERIIIIDDENELTNNEVLQEFHLASGDVVSYTILRHLAIEIILKKPQHNINKINNSKNNTSKLDDAVLIDDYLFLHYKRNSSGPRMGKLNYNYNSEEKEAVSALFRNLKTAKSAKTLYPFIMLKR